MVGWCWLVGSLVGSLGGGDLGGGGDGCRVERSGECDTPQVFWGQLCVPFGQLAFAQGLTV